MVSETERFWETRYAAQEQTWSGRVNPWLPEVAERLTPGRALDLGCGEGADTEWLARAGWEVVAADVSPTALRRTEERVAAAGLADRVRVERHDLELSRPTGPFDLVSAQFLMSPIAFARDRVLQALAPSIVPGGRLLIVDHGAAPPWSSHQHDTFLSPEETWAATGLGAAGWTLERCETRSREATHRGHSGTLEDVLVLARRAA